jgi:hypothetical protein
LERSGERAAPRHRIQTGEVIVGDEDAARARTHETEQQLDERALPGSVISDHRDDGAGEM